MTDAASLAILGADWTVDLLATDEGSGSLVGLFPERVERLGYVFRVFILIYVCIALAGQSSSERGECRS